MRIHNIILLSGTKVPLSLPALDRECCIFGLARQKIVYARWEQIKNASNRMLTCNLGHSLLLLPRCVIYYTYSSITILKLKENNVLSSIDEFVSILLAMILEEKVKITVFFNLNLLYIIIVQIRVLFMLSF